MSPRVILDRQKNDYLLLVNKTHPVDPDWFKKMELVPLINHQKEEILLEKETRKAFLAMKEDMEKEGLWINAVSGYRSREEQELIFQEKIEEGGREYAEQYCALPGFSEHETGLAVDVEYDLLFGDLEMRYNPVFARYGFIERYPEGKEMITGYNPESWHLRYVGEEYGKEIQSSGLTLEEFLERREEKPGDFVKEPD
ncbi:MAG: M15 family metallopeptidase [Solobacterium sp.]|nr:M15 family metallopeptidase [Solobacterium sp.]